MILVINFFLSLRISWYTYGLNYNFYRFEITPVIKEKRNQANIGTKKRRREMHLSKKKKHKANISTNQGKEKGKEKGRRRRKHS